MSKENIYKILEKENIDLEKFETSEEYRCMACNSITNNIYQNFIGFSVTIDGDVTHITMFGKDEVKLNIVYSLRADILSTEQLAIITVKNERHKKWIRENVRPNTRMKLTGKYNGKINGFDLVEIIDTSLEMKFGHYICSECGYNFGRKVEADYCCACGGTKLDYVNNFYE